MKLKNKKKVLLTQQARVLELLWELYGSYNLSKQLGYSPSLANAWKRKLGYVPLTAVGHVSRRTGIDKYLLNYEQMCDLMGKPYPSWEKLVKSVKEFDKLDLDYIFKGSPPCINE